MADYEFRRFAAKESSLVCSHRLLILSQSQGVPMLSSPSFINFGGDDHLAVNNNQLALGPPLVWERLQNVYACETGKLASIRCASVILTCTCYLDSKLHFWLIASYVSQSNIPACRKHHPGTDSCFLDSDQHLHWIVNCHSILCVYGNREAPHHWCHSPWWVPSL